MTDSAALLADELLPAKPIRQWVLSLPFALRFLLAADARVLTQVLGIFYRTISAHILKKAGLTRAMATNHGRGGRSQYLAAATAAADQSQVFFPEFVMHHN
jgi:hypothetical protein